MRGRPRGADRVGRGHADHKPADDEVLDDAPGQPCLAAKKAPQAGNVQQQAFRLGRQLDRHARAEPLAVLGQRGKSGAVGGRVMRENREIAD